MTDVIPPFQGAPHAVEQAQFARFCQPRPVFIREGQTLQDVMARALPNSPLRRHAVVLMEGEVIPAENWRLIRPKSGTRVQVGLRPAGDAGKKVLRTALTIAVVVVASWIAGPAGAALLGSTFIAGAAAAAFTVAATLTINALLPPPGATQSTRPEVDPTYSLTGTRNQLRPRATVEVPLGTHRFTPSLITEQLQQAVGDDIWLSFGVAIGIGNFEVSDWKLGETPLENYEGVTIQESLTVTSAPQTLIPGDFTQKDLGIELDTGWHVERTNSDAADIDVMLSFPRGLGTSDDKGRPESVQLTVEVQYREVRANGTVGDWRGSAAVTGAEADEAAQGGGFLNRFVYSLQQDRLDNFYANLPNGGTELNRTYRRSDTKPFARRIRIAVPPGFQYDVRVRRSSAKDTDVGVANDVTWFKLNTWSDRNLTPDPRLATAFFRLKASGELSGVVSNLNCKPSKIIPTFKRNPLTFDPAFATPADWEGNDTTSRNCADVLLDVGRGLHTRRPAADEDYFWPDVAAFWIWCDEMNYVFDLPIVQDLSRNEVEEMVAAAGRARIYRGGDGKKHIVIDRVRTEGATQIITPKNARGFTFTRTFSPPVHALTIPFTNADNGFQDDSVKIYAPGFDENNATEFQEITTPGTTTPDKVFELGELYLNDARLLTTVVNFEMDVEGTTMSLGQFVRLQHPILNSVAGSARVTTVAGPTLTLDTPIPFSAGFDYVMRFRRVVDHSDGTGSIEAEGLLTLINPAAETDVVTLSESLPEGVDLKEGDLVTIGIAGEDTFEGLVKNIVPAGPRQIDVELVAYLPERLTRTPPPAHTPRIGPVWDSVPTPELIGVTTGVEGLTVSFDVPAAREPSVAGFRAQTRLTPPGGTSGGEAVLWTALPDLSADQRSLTLPPDRPSESRDVRVFAVGVDGTVSAPLQVQDIAAATLDLAPQNLILTPRVEGGSNTAQFGVVDVAVTDGDPAFLDRLLIEWRAVQPAGLPWSAPTTAPATNPVKTLTGLPPGMVVQVRVAWVDHRGSETPEADRPTASVTVPATFTAEDVRNVGGRGVATFLQEFDEKLNDADLDARLKTAADLILTEFDDGTGLAQGTLEERLEFGFNRTSGIIATGTFAPNLLDNTTPKTLPENQGDITFSFFQPANTPDAAPLARGTRPTGASGTAFALLETLDVEVGRRIGFAAIGARSGANSADLRLVFRNAAGGSVQQRAILPEVITTDKVARTDYLRVGRIDVVPVGTVTVDVFVRIGAASSPTSVPFLEFGNIFVCYLPDGQTTLPPYSPGTEQAGLDAVNSRVGLIEAEQLTLTEDLAEVVDDTLALAEANAAGQVGRAIIRTAASTGDANTAVVTIGAFKENGDEFNVIVNEADAFAFRGANGKGFVATGNAFTAEIPFISESPDGETVVIRGNGFGANNDLIRWEGPNFGDPSACTRENGTAAFTVNRELWQFGAKLGGAAIETSQSIPDVGIVTQTGIGSNGNTKTATASVRITASRTSSQPSGTEPTGQTTSTLGQARIILRHRAAGDAWTSRTQVASNGTVTRTVTEDDLVPQPGSTQTVQEDFLVTTSDTVSFPTMAVLNYDAEAESAETIPSGFLNITRRTTIATTESG
ncbi:TipJ family phage tail tip protein [Litorimonas sp. WD9-15]|uniref:TipJ family phage tail tip protein n=1 Tax=Litorimonas sp. WD9-15 TaxID=3418716 RepID=UPI003D0827F1